MQTGNGSSAWLGVAMACACSSKTTHGTTNDVAEFVVETTGNVAQDFLNALDAIRSSAAGCQFGLHADSALDLERVNLKLTQGGVQSDLFNTSSAARCSNTSNAWYYVRDDQGTPTHIEVCPDVCTVLHEGVAQVDLQVGCATRIR